MPATYDSSSNCPHCSRAPYAGHHVDCPEHPDRKPQPVTIAPAVFAELKAAWMAVPNGGQVPRNVAQWLQPLINACTLIVDPDGKLGASQLEPTDEVVAEPLHLDADEVVDEVPPPITGTTDVVAEDDGMAARIDAEMAAESGPAGAVTSTNDYFDAMDPAQPE